MAEFGDVGPAISRLGEIISSIPNTLLVMEAIRQKREEAARKRALADFLARTQAAIDSAPDDAAREAIRERAATRLGTLLLAGGTVAKPQELREVLGGPTVRAMAGRRLQSLLDPRLVEQPPTPVPPAPLTEPLPLGETALPAGTFSLPGSRPLLQTTIPTTPEGAPIRQVPQRRLADLLAAVSESPELVQAISKPDVLLQFRAEGALPGTALFQAQEQAKGFAERLKGIEPALGGTIPQFRVTGKDLEATFEAPKTREQVLALEAARLATTPEGRKAFVEEKGVGPQDKLQRGIDLMKQGIEAKRALTGGMTPLGTVINPLTGEEAERVRIVSDAMIQQGRALVDEALGRPPQDVLRPPPADRKQAIQEYTTRWLKVRGIDPAKLPPDQARAVSAELEAELRRVFGPEPR